MALPQVLADEIISKYSDALRTGRIRLNGRLVTWPAGAVSGATHRQLQAFVASMKPELNAIPEWQDVVSREIDEVLYCILKAVSINYMLFDVMCFLRHETGLPDCSIETRDDSRRRGSSPAAEYFVNLRPDRSLQAGITFSKRGNIVSCTPGEPKKDVQGTLSSVQVDSKWSLEFGASLPVCLVNFRLRRTFASFVCCKSSSVRETIQISEALCSGHRSGLLEHTERKKNHLGAVHSNGPASGSVSVVSTRAPSTAGLSDAVSSNGRHSMATEVVSPSKSSFFKSLTMRLSGNSQGVDARSLVDTRRE
jgi:hypothetical protein